MFKALCVLLLTCLLGACTATQQIASANSNQCAQVPWSGSPIVPGTIVTLAQCFGHNQTQQWTLKGHQIVGVTGMCLDAQAGTAADSAQVVVAPCNGSPTQSWQMANGQIHGSDGRCLAVPGGDVAEGSPLTVSTCTASPGQQWSLR